MSLHKIASPPKSPRAAAPALKGDIGIVQFYATYLMGAAFPATAGLLLYGPRAALMLLLMLSCSLLSMLLWRRVGARGRQLHLSHGIWLTTLLWLMLPAHLLSAGGGAKAALWAIPAGGAVLLVILTWLLGGTGSGRVHPVLVTYLLLVVLFDPLLAGSAVLQRHRWFTGDITDAAQPATSLPAYLKDGYLQTPPVMGHDALRLEAPGSRLLAFTSGKQRAGRSWISIESLLRDQMPPLEDLVIGAYPGPVGVTCAVAVIVGGLFVLYRGVIDFRVPLTVMVGAYLALLSMPIPVVIREAEGPGSALHATSPPAAGEGPEWRWLAFRERQLVEVGLAKAMTFANYEVMAGPMLLMAFFIATAPVLRPMARRARVLYGLLAGILAAGLQLYVSVSWGPYLALLIVSMLTPLLERAFRQHPLV